MKHTKFLTRYAFLAPAMIFMSIFYLVPIIKSIQLGFQNYSISSFYTGKAPYVGLQNYRDVIHLGNFGKALENTILFTVASIFFQFTIGLSLAVLFRREFPLSRILQGLLLAPWLISLIAASAVWKWILDQDSGILNQFLNFAHLDRNYPGWLVDPKYALVSIILINIWIGIPFNAVILLSGIREIPEDIFEAAEIDGASGFRSFRHIVWPLLRPVTAIVLLLGVVYTLKVLDIILATTNGGPADATQTIATKAYFYSFVDFSFGRGAAMNNILILISLAFAFLYWRLSRKHAND